VAGEDEGRGASLASYSLVQQVSSMLEGDEDGSL
jgi:hypothetical protein